MNKNIFMSFILLCLLLTGCSSYTSSYDNKRLFTQKELNGSDIYLLSELCNTKDDCKENIDTIKTNIQSAQSLGVDYRQGVTIDDKSVTINHLAHNSKEIVFLYDTNSQENVPLISFYQDGKLTGYFISEGLDLSSLDATKGKGYDLFLEQNNVSSLIEFDANNSSLKLDITTTAKNTLTQIIEIGTIIETKNPDFSFEEEFDSIKDLIKKAKESYNGIKQFIAPTE